MNAPSPANPVLLGDVETSQRGKILEIRVSAHGITPHKMVMKDPDRIVLDFRGAEYGGNQRIPVNQGDVQQLRISQFQKEPPVARIVVDLNKPVRSRLANAGDTVILEVGADNAESVRAAARVPEKPSAAKAPWAQASVPKRSPVETQSSTSVQGVTVENVSVHQQNNDVSFSVKLSQPVTPKLWSEREPDRIVVDFPGTLPGNTARRITVGNGAVQTVRVALYQENPPVTRIVFDVASGTKKPQLEPNGNELTIKFQGENVARASAAPAPKAESRPASGVANSNVATVHRAGAQVSHPAAISRAVDSHPATAPAPTKQAETQPEAVDMLVPHPPSVRFVNGLLSIDAQNSVLTDILFEVGAKTGAEIQMPPWSDAGRERVVAKLGPGNPRDVIAALLHGSSFNYVIVQSPQGLQQLILTPKVDWAGPANDQPPPVAAAPADDPPVDPPQQPPDNPQQ